MLELTKTQTTDEYAEIHLRKVPSDKAELATDTHSKGYRLYVNTAFRPQRINNERLRDFKPPSQNKMIVQHLHPTGFCLRRWQVMAEGLEWKGEENTHDAYRKTKGCAEKGIGLVPQVRCGNQENRRLRIIY